MQATWMPWANKVKAFDPEYDGLFDNLVVPTAETVRQSFMIDIHAKFKKGVMMIGIAGTGKTTVVKDYFSAVNQETTATATINCNSFTDSKALQTVLVGEMAPRTGIILGPPPGKQLIFFMDDLNMPKVDVYGT